MFNLIWYLVLGIVLISFGIVFCVNSSILYSILRIFLFVYLLCDGLYKIVNSFNYLKLKLKYWWVSLVLGLIYIALGFALFYGLNLEKDIAIFAGILFIVTGVSFIVDWISKLIINKPIKEKEKINETSDNKNEGEVIDGEILDYKEDKK